MQYRANVLFISLFMIMGIMLFIFLSYDSFLIKDRKRLADYHHYLNDKINLLMIIADDYDVMCRSSKQPKNHIEFDYIKYEFNCTFKSIFIKPKPTKSKYIQTNNINEWLDLTTYQEHIYYFSSLSELPNSSITNPQIAIATNEIDEKLTKNFYGIIITEYFFDITGKKIYGVIYSSYDNARKERNLSYKRKVVDNIEQKLSTWYYLSQSKNILSNEE
ncbi:DUF2572 family protein [Otariodibacter sp.]|uniref:DUF2572 family protein n=1 Tax=Otariodibacter sp. TaxID=3030919 RepID=UPI00261910EA|nr:DUF2572 family protein [Otariodibacter sp.]